MIDSTHTELSIRQQCQLLSVSRSTLYYKAKPACDDTNLANEIHALWLAMPFYGYRRLTAELRRQGVGINGKRVLRLMRDMKIEALYPKPRTTLKTRGHKIYPYLLKELEINRPNQVWATDITYLKMPLGFAYLVALIDVHSRYIVAWRLSNTLDTSFCLEMLEDGLKSGCPEILNTDQGCQFTSEAWVNRVQEAGIEVSMDGKGRWVDNVIMERFWRTLKHEHFSVHCFEDLAEARHSIGDFINIYNNRRLHQSLGYRTPSEAHGLTLSPGRFPATPQNSKFCGLVDNSIEFPTGSTTSTTTLFTNTFLKETEGKIHLN
jgi:putative transposase